MKFPFTVENLLVEDILVDGRGLARWDDRVVFLNGALPGDVVDARIYRKKRKVLEADVIRRVTDSPDRVAPVCQHFGTCGGCKWQHLSYEAQLRFKQKQVHDALTRIGGVTNAVFHPIVPAPAPYSYRNKLEFSFSCKRWFTSADPTDGSQDSRVAGFHVPRFFDKVLEIHQCHLQDDRVNAVRNAVQAYGRAHGIPFYDAREKTGFLRNLVFRTSQATGEMMAVLIVGNDDDTQLLPLIEMLHGAFPFLSTVASIVNTKPNDSYSELPVRIHHGPSFLTEQLGDCRFRISPTSFFQTNTAQAERLYQVVRVALGMPVHRLYDLYCGAGTIGMYLHDMATEVIGIEYVASSIADAEENAKRNGFSGFRFFAGDIAKLLTPEWVAEVGVPGAIVVDPPRAGMHPDVVAQLNQLAVPLLVYVSCNPATQARDIQLLSEQYTVTDVTAVDMFPQTSHVESVVRLVCR